MILTTEEETDNPIFLILILLRPMLPMDVPQEAAEAMVDLLIPVAVITLQAAVQDGFQTVLQRHQTAVELLLAELIRQTEQREAMAVPFILQQEDTAVAAAAK